MTDTPAAAEDSAAALQASAGGRRRAGRLAPALCLALLAASLLLPGLGATRFIGEDEARYAGTTRNMLETGDWIVPRLNEVLRPQKPILIYWMMGSAFKVFGVGEFAARLWPALTGILLVLATFLFSAPLLGTRTALIAALLLAVCPAFFTWGRLAVTDVPLTLFVTFAALSVFYGAERPPPAKRGWHCAAAVALGLGMLVKGPVAVLLALLVVVPYLVVRGRLRTELREGAVLAAVLIFLALAAPWFVVVSLRTDGEFTRQFFLSENLLRYFESARTQIQPLYYYLPVTLVLFLPWSGLLPYALWRGLRTGTTTADSAAHRLRLLCALWFALVFVFFSLSKTKLASYLLPLAPAAAILVAMQWEEWRRGFARRSFVASSLFAALLVAACAAFLLNLPRAVALAQRAAAPGFPTPDFAGAHWLAGGALALSLLAWGVLCLLRRRELVPWALAAGMGLSAAAITGPLMRAMDRSWQTPLSMAAQNVGQMAPPGQAVAIYNCDPSPVAYYSRRKVHRLRDLQDLGQRGLKREVWIVAPLSARPRLEKLLNAELKDGSAQPFGVFVAPPAQLPPTSEP